MLNEKRIKGLIIISVLLIEAFVWTTGGSSNYGKDQIIGRADGPTSIYIGRGGTKPDIGKQEQGEPKPVEPEPGKGPQGSAEPEKPDLSGGQAGEKAEPPMEDPQEVEIPPVAAADRAAALKTAQRKGLLLLVNKKHPIDEAYRPKDLKKVKYGAPDRAEETHYMRAEAAAAFQHMVEDAAKDGIELKMTTAYRSYDFQKMLFESYVEKEGEEKANTYSAKPGQSEHQTGLSVDVSSPSVDYQLSNDYGKTKEGEWVAAHAHEYGFILRFPKGKEDVTGYQFEPWHLRYVGLLAAKEIYEQKLTLEEYLTENKID